MNIPLNHRLLRYVKVYLLLIGFTCLCLLTAFLPISKPPTKAHNSSLFPTSAYHVYDESIRLIAHRGYAKHLPENTLAAIAAAGNAGFWGCEFDIRRTADGQWVLMHDDSLLRTAGVDKRISQTNYDELPQLYTTPGDTYKIPTLQEALTVCEQYSLKAHIEVKSTQDAPLYAKEILALLQKSNVGRHSVIISFNQNFLSVIKEYMPAMQTALLTKKLTPSQVAFAEESQIGLDIRYELPLGAQPLLQEAASKNLLYSCYTVNNTDSLYDLYVFGLRTFTTDNILPEKTAIMQTSTDMPSLPIFRRLLTKNRCK